MSPLGSSRGRLAGVPSVVAADAATWPGGTTSTLPGTGNAWSIPRLAGTSPGDVVIFFGAWGGGSITSYGVWNQIATGSGIFPAAWRRVGVGESGNHPSFITAEGNSMQWAQVVIRGVGPDPGVAAASATQLGVFSGGGAPPYTLPSVTPPRVGVVIGCLFSRSSGVGIPSIPPGMTELHRQAMVGIFSLPILVPNVATGDKVGTVAAGGGSHSTGEFMVAA